MAGSDPVRHRWLITILTGIGVVAGVAVAVFTADVIIGVADEAGLAGRHDLGEVIHRTHVLAPSGAFCIQVLLAAPSVMPHRRAHAASPSSRLLCEQTRKLCGAATSR